MPKATDTSNQDNPTPLANSAELRKLLLSVLYEYEGFYKIGYDDGRDGKEKNWSLATGLAEKHADVATKRIERLLTQHNQALLQKIEEAMPKDLADTNYATYQIQNILNQAREGKL